MISNSSETGSGGANVLFNTEECLSLQQVLDAFEVAISEDRAWALLYQGGVTLRKGLTNPRHSATRCPIEPRDFFIHKNGTVHPRTIYPMDSGETEPLSETKLVKNLATIVYTALDYCQQDDEERVVSNALGTLIDEMVSVDNDSQEPIDDEGIEGDDEEYSRITLEDVIKRCSSRIGESSADTHYQAVCRVLVTEAVELSQFLERVRDSAGDLCDRADAAGSRNELTNLQFSDWARFWMQVIGELRMGWKLKKVNYSRTPVEYELTPYEILMDDIRLKKYKLRKVDGNIPPRVKKDAHAMILEYIRSRPPLKKASERKLPPAVARPATPREQLLDSIKRGRSLKPTHTICKSKLAVAPCPARRRPREEEPEPGHSLPVRRLIKVDFEPLDDDDDDDLEDTGYPEVSAVPQPLPRSFTRAPQPKPSSPKPWKRTASPPRAPPRTHITHDEYHQFCDDALESYDLATQCPSRRASMRRHTIVTSSKPADVVSGSQSVPQSRPDSRQSGLSVASSDVEIGGLGNLGDTPNDISWSRTSLQEELIQSVSAPSNKQWQDAMSLDNRLSLTLEEIVHIRSVLTKAELEALPVEGRVKEDVEKNKVCFLCLKTRFGLLGPWGQRCKLCKKTVCSKCYSKMRIPTEHFANVPVVLLSPSLMPSPEEEVNTSFPRSLMARLMSPEHNNVSREGRSDNSVGSAPSSPSLQRSQANSMARSLEGTLNASPQTSLSCVQSAPGSRGGSSMGYVPDSTPPLTSNSTMTRSMEGPQSLPVSNGSPRHTLDRRSKITRGATLAAARASDRLRGVQMIVCHDCKTMVLQIIKSSRTSRSATRNHAIRNLTLNLSPIYPNNN